MTVSRRGVLLQPTAEGQMAVFYQTGKSPWLAADKQLGTYYAEPSNRRSHISIRRVGCSEGNHPISPQSFPFSWKLLSLSDSTCSSAFTGDSGPWFHE